MQISVIIPTYKPCEYIYQCLDSLMGQTFSKEQFEVIIVLNGCNEPYKKDINEWRQRHRSLNLNIIQTSIAGVSNARNIGIEQAQGDSILFLDDDDWLSPCYLEKILFSRFSAENKTELKDIIVVSNIKDYREKTGEILDGYLALAANSLRGQKQLTLFRARSFYSNACCKLIPRHLIGNQRFDSRFTLSEDALFMASLASKKHSIVLSSEECIYFRRIHQGSAQRKETNGYTCVYSARLIAAFLKIYFLEIFRNRKMTDFSYHLFMMSRVAATMAKTMNLLRD